MKKNKYIFLYCFLAFASVLLFSAKELPTRSGMIRGEVATRIAKFEKTTLEKCTRDILERAGEMADSILIARARLQVNEIVPKPEIPFRPERPEIKLPKDTTPIVPIFPKGDTTFSPREALEGEQDN
ncbi:MAG: hypothetical protein ACI8YQ_002331 [Polaribacter sp.]|jgi:hypothetical protein